MKNQAIHYLGLDVHQATTVVSVRNEHGTIVIRETVRTNAEAILALGQGVGAARACGVQRRHAGAMAT